MKSFGQLTAYATGHCIRPATAAEWRKTAERVSIHNVHQGFWRDDDGRVVYVDGGPEANITNDDIRALRGEAAAAGDLAQVALCDRALEFADADELVTADDYAWEDCARVILDSRMVTAAAASVACFAAALGICAGGMARFGKSEPVGPVFGSILATLLLAGVLLALAPAR